MQGWAQLWCEIGRRDDDRGGFSLGGGPFGEQSALHFVEEAPFGCRFEAFAGDFGEGVHDAEARFANHFRVGCR